MQRTIKPDQSLMFTPYDVHVDELVFQNVDQADKFSIHGVFREGIKYRRMPEEVARQTSEGVYGLHDTTTGGRVRFVTNSRKIAVYAKYSKLGLAGHCPMTGTTSFDLYEKVGQQQIHVSTFVPPVEMKDVLLGAVDLEEARERLLTIHFPIHCDILELYVGVDVGAEIRPAPAYTYPVPVVYYGSSITHGLCASHGGTTYPAMVSHMLDCDYVNLGFSGNAKAEDTMAEYIKGLEMSVFVYDYDHNAPSLEHLEATHEKMFQTIRQAHPDLPIVILSRPKARLTAIDWARQAIIRKTYDNAKAAGDKNVYFIPGTELLPEEIVDWATVDVLHPTDLGFYFMAKRVAASLNKILK